MARLRELAAGGIMLVLAGCTTSSPSGIPGSGAATSASATSGSAASATATSATDAPSPAAASPSLPAVSPTAVPSGSARAATPDPTSSPDPTFDARAVLGDIRRLSQGIGPREATSRSFRRAAAMVQERFEALGFEVSTETVEVPAGNSWGTPVRAGTSRNVIADMRGFDAAEPHVVLVAHLDTVPVAPGAEDNASGVAVLLELARLAAAEPPELPVRLVAFGAEEPRGLGDELHHFGSQQHVAELTREQRDAIRGVVALDRVGVRASAVPVCSARSSGNALRSEVRQAAEQAGVPTRGCTGNTTSDHWSYTKAGVPAIRLGSVPYAGYHSAGDTLDVIDRRQIDRVGQAMWAWLQAVG